MALSTPTGQRRRPAVAVLLGLMLALLGAGLALGVGLPLPWLLGPLLVTASTRIAGVPSRCPPAVNRAGRWVIGMSLGLYFTPEVGASVLQHWPLILFGMVHALLLAAVGCLAYHRLGGLDLGTAWFAAAIGSASEIANMAQRAGARVDQVVSAHSLRVLLIVLLVPFGFQWVLGNLPAATDVRDVRWPGLAVLLVISLAAVWAGGRLRLPNPWILGPLLLVMGLSLSDVRLSALPSWLSWAGQLCIGWSLGDRYRPDFLRSAPRLLSVVGVMSLSFLGLTLLLSQGLSWLTGLPVSTLVLGLVPGGIAEMTITAKVLGLGVPVVTAMQVLRMLCVVFATPLLYRWLIQPRCREGGEADQHPGR